MSTSVVVAHTFEAAHRLPQLPGKCVSLHGHSWRVEVTLSSDSDLSFIVDFGLLKKGLREWIDARLDHGTMLGIRDPLVQALYDDERCKVFIFEESMGAWPTVENVARLMAAVAARHLDELIKDKTADASAYVSRVVIHETSVNRAEWTA